MSEEYRDITLCTSVIKQMGVVEGVGGQQIPVWDLSANRERSSEPDIATVICEICTTPLAKIDLNKMHRPITTDMFLPLDPHHGQLVPFIPGIEFQFMLCPCCRKRFANTEDRIRTDRGYVEVPVKTVISTFEPVSQGGAAAAREVHTLDVDGSIPSPATIITGQQENITIDNVAIKEVKGHDRKRLQTKTKRKVTKSRTKTKRSKR